MSKTASSTKAKDKKAARKAAAEKALQVQALLKQLLQDPDLLAPFPVFKTYSRNGLNLNLQYYTAESMPTELKAWAFDLTKTNIQQAYEECPGWGWSDSKKRKELEDSNARFIVAIYGGEITPQEETKNANKTTNSNSNVNDTTAAAAKSPSPTLTPGQAVAFIHIRFEMEGDDPVLYVYEFHVDSAIQGRGVGRFLMQMTELIARKSGLARVMLTVFRTNAGANGLYSKLGYTLDESSPGTVDPAGDHGYEILSKLLPPPPPAAVKKSA